MAQEETELTVSHPHGLHARPAAQFVRTAALYASAITLRNLQNGKTVDAKSIMQVLTAGINEGSRVSLSADGEDAAEAIAALHDLIAHGLDDV